MTPIKLFAPPSHYDPFHRGELIDLLKPFWGKEPDFDDVRRMDLYGLSDKDVAFVTASEDCDMAVLPMSWNHYRQCHRMEIADGFVRQAAACGKRVLSWTSGDFGVRVPNFDNLIVLRSSGYHSRLPNYHVGIPSFIRDPLREIYGTREVPLREWQAHPVIGFCGQAGGNTVKYAWDKLRTVSRNLAYHLGWSWDEPQQMLSSTRLREKVLRIIEAHPRLRPNFIRRMKYRAGAVNESERRRTTLEFYDNMLHSDYIVCVRGGGNFSVRLYETLAMGRIPVIVNTDCLLPLSDQVDWKKHVVWVESGEINKIADVVFAFHHRLDPLQFQELQQRNRDFWNDKLRLGNFFKAFIEAKI